MPDVSPATPRISDDAPTLIVETPALTDLSSAAVCLHFVQNRLDFEGIVEGEREISTEDANRAMCSVVCSLELDLLSFKYQEQPPLQTNLTYADEARTWCQVDAVFPAVITFTSENVTRRLVRPVAEELGQHRVRCEARLAQSYFPESHVVIWHLILTACGGQNARTSTNHRPGCAFDEYDLIKLMHLYEHDTEQVELADRVQFEVRRMEDSEPVRCGLRALLSVVWECLAGAEFRRAPYFAPPANSRPRCGTIQLVAGPSLGGEPVGRMFDLIHLARHESLTPRLHLDEKTGPSASDTLREWLEDAEPSAPGAALKALAGVTNAIFDFNEVDAEEVLDTLDPTYRGGRSFIKFHRRSLVDIRDDDRVLNAIRTDLGMNPYLIVPHAIVLHNEELVDRLEQNLDAYAACKDIRRLERLSALARRVVRRMNVPNVFNYATERTLYDRAFEIRGSAEKFRRTVRRAEELDVVLEKAYEHRRRRHDIAVQALLLLLALAQVVSLFVRPMPDPGIARVMMVAALLAIAGIYFVFRSRW